MTFVVLAVLAGALLPRPFWQRGPDEPAERRILVLTNPIHTDIAIPIGADVLERFAFLQRDGVPTVHPDARWLIFGWGGRSFYLETPTWADLKPGPVLRALTVDRSVIHVDVAGAITEPHPAVTGFDLGAGEFDRLLDYISGTFQRSAGEPILVSGASYGTTDRFYEAEGWFNALVGCNTWTARGLREAGLRTGLWNPLPPLLSASLKLHN